MRLVVDVRDETRNKTYPEVEVEIDSDIRDELIKVVSEEMKNRKRLDEDREIVVTDIKAKCTLAYKRPELDEATTGFLNRLVGKLRENGIAFVDIDDLDPDLPPEGELGPELLRIVQEALLEDQAND